MKKLPVSLPSPSIRRRALGLAIGFVIGGTILSGCSSMRRAEESSAAPQETDAQKIERLQIQNKELTANLSAMTAKVEGLETRIGSMTDKMEATQTRLENLMSNHKAKPAPVQELPTEGVTKLPPVGDDERETSFSSDDAIRKYRQSMILFESRNYPEAVLGFSAFVDQYPDHPLAGSAQYHLGASYYKQKEYKLAAREFQRVITSYDRSPHIADTLRDLSDCEGQLGLDEEAARHRQLLTSLFPHSPAAAHQGAIEESRAAPQRPKKEPEPENAAAPREALDAPPPTAPISAPAAEDAHSQEGSEH